MESSYVYNSKWNSSKLIKSDMKQSLKPINFNIPVT